MNNTRIIAEQEWAKKYPEAAKVSEAKLKGSQAIGAFLEWLQDQGIVLSQYHIHTDDCLDLDGRCECGMFETLLYSIHKSPDDLLFEYFGIDRQKYNQEQEAMLEEIREYQKHPCDNITIERSDENG